MASIKTYTINRYLTTTATAVHNGLNRTNSIEFTESDIWGGFTDLTTTTAESKPTEIRSSFRPNRKPIMASRKGGEAMSVPVNVPDWSKILREEYKEKWCGGLNGGEEEVNGEEEWMAPHEYLARTRHASFSVQEGIGRTLKGRDLSRVRNAIWEKTGFQD